MKTYSWNYFPKISILNVWIGSAHASADLNGNQNSKQKISKFLETYSDIFKIVLSWSVDWLRLLLSWNKSFFKVYFYLWRQHSYFLFRKYFNYFPVYCLPFIDKVFSIFSFLMIILLLSWWFFQYTASVTLRTCYFSTCSHYCLLV